MVIRLFSIIMLVIGSLFFGISQDSVLAGFGLFMAVYSVLFLIEFND